ncbi:hypothetical protein STEG23_009913, partial [Scotinomys teguina]
DSMGRSEVDPDSLLISHLANIVSSRFNKESASKSRVEQQLMKTSRSQPLASSHSHM